MSESDSCSVASVFSDISFDDRHPDEIWTGVRNNPRIHAFVAFSINAAVSLDTLYGEDVSEGLNMDNLPHNTYVGFLEQIRGIPFYDNPYTECRIYFITQGLPSDANRCIEPEMSVPLWPATEHPSGREPIKLRDPLPWPNCYLLSTMYVDVRVLSAEFDHAKVEGVMFFPEAMRNMKFRDEDQAKQRALVKDRASGGTEHPQIVVEHNVEDRFETHEAVEIVENPVHGETSLQEEVGTAIYDIMCADPSDNISVDASYNLSAIPTLPDPREFFEETKALRKLAQEFIARKAALDAEEEAGWAREMKNEQERLLAGTTLGLDSPPVSPTEPHSARSFPAALLGSRDDVVDVLRDVAPATERGTMRPGVYSRIRKYLHLPSKNMEVPKVFQKKSRFNPLNLFSHSQVGHFTFHTSPSGKKATILSKLFPSGSKFTPHSPNVETPPVEIRRENPCQAKPSVIRKI